MALPLYKIDGNCKPKLGTHGNAGLWFDKYCDSWNKGWSMAAGKDDANPKGRWIKTLAGNKAGDRAALQECAHRLGRLVLAQNGRLGILETSSRFVTGLGRSHPVENGFAWHHALGTPYLPGSSIKGMVRSWAREWESTDGDDLNRIFGKPDRAGSIYFFDALPVDPVLLEMDVITPHYAGWDENDPPGDWRSPVPIPFLVTAAGSRFLFGLGSRSGATEEDINKTWGWLVQALEHVGAGAKTAVGYGRFRYADDRTEQLEKKLKTAPPPPAEELSKWAREIRGKSEQQLLDLVRIHLEKETIEDPQERREFLEAVMATGWVNEWKRGRKVDQSTQIGDKKLKDRGKRVVKALDDLDNDNET